MSEGWIKIHRKIKENPIFRDSVKLHLFVYCLVNASHKGHKAILGGREVFLQPGQFITGRLRAAMETGLTQKQVRAGLKALEMLDFLALKSSRGQAGTIVTICNWNTYQYDTFENEEDRARHGPSMGQAWATIQEWKEGKEKSEISRECEESSRSVKIPDDILSQAESVFGLTIEATLIDWIGNRNWNLDWIREAIPKAESKKIRGSRAIRYVESILQDWKLNGKPENKKNVSQNNRKGRMEKKKYTAITGEDL